VQRGVPAGRMVSALRAFGVEPYQSVDHAGVGACGARSFARPDRGWYDRACTCKRTRPGASKCRWKLGARPGAR
jgi:hypothetical protein